MEETVYSPSSPVRHPLALVRGFLADVVASRELAMRLFIRDFTAQYRQSALGYLWAIAPPLIFAIPWLFLSSQNILNAGDTALPYAAFVLAGTTVWATFADSLLVPLMALTSGKQLLTKINFPREALVLGGLGQLATNTILRVLVMMAVLLALGVPMGVSSFLMGMVGLVAVIIAGLALGVLTSPIGLLYTDVQRALTLGLGIWMILTPVFYTPPRSGLAGWLARWNPASPLVTTVRDWFTGQPAEFVGGFAIVTVLSVVLLFIGMLVLRVTLPMVIERSGT
jgi:lipopolysaccharide transport system permease protein